MREMKIRDFLHKHRVLLIDGLVILSLVGGASLIYAMRFQPAFDIPNFYAEDGRVFLNNILHKNFFEAVFTGFNGYLISGLYLLLYVAYWIYQILGLHFYQLPAVIAAVSCLFLGLTVTLPYILFKRELGRVLAICLVALGAFLPMPSFDYAIIGTVGNLKFAFLYWAFLLVIFRMKHKGEQKKLLLVDSLLLLCITTNAPTIFIIPFALWAYRSELRAGLKRRSFRPLKKVELISLLSLLFLSVLYLAVVYLKGIPQIPGYLDTPYRWESTLKIIYRVTIYSWFYPISSTMRDLVTLLLVSLFIIYGIWHKRSRFVTIFGTATIFIATAGFVVNRPGVSEYFLLYGPSPDQFFYAQNLVFAFIAAWLVKGYIKNSIHRQFGLLLATFIFLWWAAPSSGSYGGSRIIYESLGTTQYNLTEQCLTKEKDITFQEYPTSEWKWTISKDIACK